MAGTYNVTVEVDGCTSPVGTTTVVVNTTIGVNEINETAMQIYPNPATDKVVIKLNEIQNIELQIFNIVGACVLEREVINGTTDIDISTMAKGMYVVEIIAAEGIIKHKLFKQ